MSFDLSGVDVEHFLGALDIRNVTIGHIEATFSCPYPAHPNGDENPSAQMNLETTAWRCYGCKERGNALTFTAHVLGVSPLEARRLIRAAYDPGAADPDTAPIHEEIERILAEHAEAPDPEQPTLPESVLRAYHVDWYATQEAYETGSGTELGAYWFQRGFQAHELTKWEFGYDPATGRFTFAIRDETGQLIGIKARATTDQKPKYLVYGDRPGKPGRYGWPIYSPARLLYGAHRLPEDAAVVVCEGELNAIAVTERGGLPAVAISGSYVSPWHARYLRQHASSVIAFLDDDDAGRIALRGRDDAQGRHHPGLVDLLDRHIPVLVVPPSAKDAAQLSGQEIRDLVNRSDTVLAERLGRR